MRKISLLMLMVGLLSTSRNRGHGNVQRRSGRGFELLKESR